MIEQEVQYERNMTGSYMKIEASCDATFDEKMLFSGKISGVLQAEQCFLNGKSWYWYNISGKQSLDTLCKMQDIGIALIEKIIISICDQIDVLEWNLIDLNCLMLRPEYIFINNISQEIYFTVYPGLEENLSLQFRELMEYLLTRIDHKDVRAVQTAYGIYEKTLDEGYDIMEIRDYVVMGRSQEDSGTGEMVQAGASTVAEQTWEAPKDTAITQGPVDNTFMRADLSSPEEKKSVFSDIMNILNEWKSSIKKVRKSHSADKDAATVGKQYLQMPDIPWGNMQQMSAQVAEDIRYGSSQSGAGSMMYGNGQDGAGSMMYGNGQGRASGMVYGGSQAEANRMMQARLQMGEDYKVYREKSIMEESVPGQTTLLSNYADFVRGVLIYEGADGLESVNLQKKDMQIGKAMSSDIRIYRNTVSQFHAKISYRDGYYYLEDLNSTNGTYVNEKPLAYKEARRLEMNDMVRFADVSYRFI